MHGVIIVPPAISFVVPAHNEEAYLARSLEAILSEIARAGCAAEVIVVDNASTDGTRAVAEGFSGVVVVDEPVKSLVCARAAGLAQARAPLVAHIDADTLLPAGWLDHVLGAFGSEPGLVALSGPYVYHDVGRRARAMVWAFYRLGYLAYLMNRHVFHAGSMLQGGNFVVRRDAMDRAEGSGSFAFYGEDTDLARRLSKVGAVRFTFRLPALSSGRRLADEGFARIGVRYALNFLWATFRKRPYTRDWIDVR